MLFHLFTSLLAFVLFSQSQIPALCVCLFACIGLRESIWDSTTWGAECVPVVTKISGTGWSPTIVSVPIAACCEPLLDVVKIFNASGEDRTHVPGLKMQNGLMFLMGSDKLPFYDKLGLLYILQGKSI
ncbi:hypothetical protein L218DRAFT_951826 [Marasmius fiardii PR-910]|nr:hypothetical protein L218DRAFT_951826 [Marasmius fiardii PR-910]